MGWFSDAINNGFNWFKGAVRSVGGTIKSIAQSISGGARMFSALPFVGSFASGLATVADGVSGAVDVANTIVNVGEGIQKGFNLNTGVATSAPAAPTAPAPTSTVVVRSPQRIVRRIPLRAY